MSIPLPALLGLSYDLSLARKRRLDWELHADEHRTEDATKLVSAGKSPELEGASGSSVDVAEMQFLRATLASKGLEPRAPDAEIAMLSLLTASFRSAKAPRTEPKALDGSDFEWMVTVNTCPAQPERSQGYFDTLCPAKAKGTGKDPSPNDALDRLCKINGSSDEDEDVFGSPKDLLNTEVTLLRCDRQAHQRPAPAGDDSVDENKAVKRLQALLRGQVEGEGARTEDSGCVAGYDSDLEFMVDTCREAMLEAEREELARLVAQQTEGCEDVESEFESKCTMVP